MTSLVQPTEGPWRAEPTNSAKQSYVVVSTVAGANGNTVVIGQCAGPDAEANASFIASAPDLKKALEKCAAKFREYEQLHRAKLADVNSPKAVAAVMEKVLRNREMADLCEAELARAEGRQP